MSVVVAVAAGTIGLVTAVGIPGVEVGIETVIVSGGTTVFSVDSLHAVKTMKSSPNPSS